MGTDIHGWIECKPSWKDEDEPWEAIIRVGWLVDRYYDAFGSFFGVRNLPLFGPIAANRGIPADASEEIQQKVQEGLARFPQEYHSHTWIAWPEIKAINWEENPTAQEDIRERLRDIYTWGQQLFQVMNALAERYEEERVRLVVWFDG